MTAVSSRAGIPAFRIESGGTITEGQCSGHTGPITGGGGAVNGGVVTTLAGSTRGYADGTGAAARFSYPSGVAVDGSGTIYVVDNGNNRIRKITPTGTVTTLAGSTWGYTDGTGSAAQFRDPRGIAVDTAGIIYVADAGNDRIRKVTPEGVVTTLAGSTRGYADGTGAAAQFSWPSGIVVDESGVVHVADTQNDRIRRVTPAGVVTTLAGSTRGYADGTGVAAQFSRPHGVAVDGTGIIYVADSGNYRVRRIALSGAVTTMAGSTLGYTDGTGAGARFSFLGDIAFDSAGILYVTDWDTSPRIRKITTSGAVTTLAGSGVVGSADGTGIAAQFNYPYGITVDRSGTLYIADQGSHRIRKIE